MEYKPECIIGIARGGFVPAVMLAYKLKCRIMGFIQYRRTSDDKPFSLYNRYNMLQGLSLPKIKISKVLLVDDIIVKGIIFKDAIHQIQMEYGRIEILGIFLYKVLGYNKHNKDQNPYIYSGIIKKNEWIIYPWEQSNI
jgi:hypoxanthine phosphoribosyltransferase